MKSYKLKIEQVDDFVPEIAGAFGVNFTNNFGEFAVSIPSHICTMIPSSILKITA